MCHSLKKYLSTVGSDLVVTVNYESTISIKDVGIKMRNSNRSFLLAVQWRILRAILFLRGRTKEN
jgi:hypothetical protein